MNLWKREAAFFVHRQLFRARYDLGIVMKTCGLAARLSGPSQSYHSFRPRRPDRGKADAGRVVHRLEHVIDELAYFAVDLFHRLGNGTQPRVG